MLILFILAFFITVSNVSAASVTPNQVANSSAAVKNYVDTNHKLPGGVNISGNNVNMPNYLGVSTSAVLNINKSSNTAITIKNYGAAPSPSETITTRTISKSEYLSMASRIKSYMDTNGRAPNYVTTSTGSTIRYESMIYMFSQILSYYNTNKVLPASVTVKSWATVISNPNIIGSKDYGYVEKKIYGNKNSNQTIVLIIGVHPQENGIHTAIANALASKSSKLTKRYVLYYVHVTKDVNDYDKSRMNGQKLALYIVVPDVPKEHPMLVVDNHENHGADSGYKYYRFLYPISKTSITTTYANKIISQMKLINSKSSTLIIYTPPNPTSPQYVTIPIANKGITTLIYETYISDSTTQKAIDANALIDALDSFDKPVDTKSPTVTVSPSGGTFNTPQTVTLTTKDPDSTTTTTYYTTDGSDPKTSNTRSTYTSSITLNSNTTLKFSAVDPANHWSPVYTETYIINTVPTVQIIDPANKAANVAVSKVIKITFSESIKNGTGWIELNGGGKAVPFTTSINGNVLTITPTNALVNATTYSLILHTGSVTDLTGNKLALYSSSFTTDRTAPTVQTIDPANSTVNVSVNKVIKITFSESIKNGTGWIELNGGGKAVPFTTSINGNVLTITPTSNLSKGTKYNLILHTGSVTDFAGNKLALYISSFTTNSTVPTIDKAAPQIVSTNPKNNATGYSRTAAISIKFSENIAASTYWSKIYIKNLSTGKIVGITKSINGSTLILKMNLNRYAYNWYQVYIPVSAVKDSAGNNLAAGYTFKFKTG